MGLGLAPAAFDRIDCNAIKEDLFRSHDSQISVMEQLLGVQFKPTSSGWECLEPDSLKAKPCESDPGRLIFYRFSGKSGPDRPSDVIAWVKDHLNCDYVEALRWIGEQTLTTPIPRNPKISDVTHRNIWSKSAQLDGCSAEKYLRHRLIYSDAVASTARFNQSTSSIVFPVTAGSGELVGVQSIALLPNGTRHSDKEKRSNGKIRKGFVRIPGQETSPVLIAEGPETAASLSIATGYTVWAGLGHIKDCLPRLANESKSIKYIACCDKFNDGDRDRIIEKANALIQDGYAITVIPYPEDAPGTDYNDMLCEVGAEAVQRAISSTPIELQKPRLKGLDALKAMEITAQEISQFASAKKIIPDLVISGHLTTIIAPANAGKTALFTHLAGDMAKQGYDVFYINADLSMSDAALPKSLANIHGWRLILPDARDGDSVDVVTQILRDMTHSNDNLSSVVIILDTLKKFTNVQNKELAKEIFMLLRALNARGATIIGLGHTKKYRDDQGNLMFDGVGDVKTDVDEMIYLESYKLPDSKLILTTYPDKSRGSFDPASFQIIWNEITGPEVHRLDTLIDTRALAIRQELMEREYWVVEALVEILKDEYELQIGQLIKKLDESLKESYGSARNRNVVSELIRRMSQEPYPFLVITKGINNAKRCRLAIPGENGDRQ
jgi:hypothetical protein